MRRIVVVFPARCAREGRRLAALDAKRQPIENPVLLREEPSRVRLVTLSSSSTVMAEFFPSPSRERRYADPYRWSEEKGERSVNLPPFSRLFCGSIRTRSKA